MKINKLYKLFLFAIKYGIIKVLEESVMKRTDRRKAPISHARRRPSICKVDNTKDLRAIVSKGKVVQDLLGISDEVATRMFEDAVGYLNIGHFDEAVSGFSLLTRLNPYIADFWLGLGIAHLRLEEYRRSFDALSMALAMDPSRFDVYSYAIECCLEMKNSALAEALLKEAISFAKRHKTSEDAELILKSAPHLFAKIVESKK